MKARSQRIRRVLSPASYQREQSSTCPFAVGQPQQRSSDTRPHTQPDDSAPHQHKPSGEQCCIPAKYAEHCRDISRGHMRARPEYRSRWPQAPVVLHVHVCGLLPSRRLDQVRQETVPTPGRFRCRPSTPRAQTGKGTPGIHWEWHCHFHLHGRPCRLCWSSPACRDFDPRVGT